MGKILIEVCDNCGDELRDIKYLGEIEEEYIQYNECGIRYIKKEFCCMECLHKFGASFVNLKTKGGWS